MFMKIPVVAYNVGGLTELNSHSPNIILVDKGNIEDLAAKILYLLKSNEDRKVLAERAFQTISQRIRPDEIVRDIMHAYDQITSEPALSR
jgi:glycosyltransferase involved in cell wall biosynthesis